LQHQRDRSEEHCRSPREQDELELRRTRESHARPGSLELGGQGSGVPREHGPARSDGRSNCEPGGGRRSGNYCELSCGVAAEHEVQRVLEESEKRSIDEEQSEQSELEEQSEHEGHEEQRELEEHEEEHEEHEEHEE